MMNSADLQDFQGSTDGLGASKEAGNLIGHLAQSNSIDDRAACQARITKRPRRRSVNDTVAAICAGTAVAQEQV